MTEYPATRLDRLQVDLQRQDAARERLADRAGVVQSLSEPVPLLADEHAVPEFVADLLPPALRGVVEDVARRMGCDLAIPAAAAIAAVCAAADHRITLRVRSLDCNWQEAARLWIEVNGPPSVKKTPALTEMLAPLMKLQAEWSDDYRVEAEAHELELKAYQKAAQVYATRRAKGERPRQPEKPQPPTWRRLAVHDATVERLTDILSDNPQGVLAVHDELSAFFGAMDAYRGAGVNKDRPDWLKAYNGGPHLVDRVSRTRHVPNWSVALLGGIQPDKLRRVAHNLDDDGLIQRFLHMPARPAGMGLDAAPNRAAWAAYERLLTRLTGEAGPQEILLGDEAQQVLDEARQTLHHLARNPAWSAALQTSLAKAEGQLARLTLIYHLAVRADADDVTVSRATAELAVRAMLAYFVPCSVWFHERFLVDDVGASTLRKVAGWIVADEITEASARDVYRAVRELRGADQRALLVRTMEQLDLAGWLHVTRRSGGEPSAWKINPLVHDRFRSAAERERTRREQARSEIREALGKLEEARQ